MAGHFTDDILKLIFLNENGRNLIQISLKFVPNSPIDNKPALIQVMAWRQKSENPFTWTNDDPVHWCIYAALGGDELMTRHCRASAAMVLRSFPSNVMLPVWKGPIIKLIQPWLMLIQLILLFWGDLLW